jgi:hypothetical protein
MADDKTLMTIAGASVAGAVLSALGHAFGFNRRLANVEKQSDDLQKCKRDFLTTDGHSDLCKATKELMGTKHDQHTKEINEIKKEISAGFRGVHERLDKILINNGGH